jgi:heavy metal translocating P-type ATPase
LPVASTAASGGGPVYCCYGCALVSRIVGQANHDSARAWLLLRLGVGAFLAMDVMTLSLLLYTGAVEPSAVGVFRWILLAISTPALALLAYPFAVGAVGEIRRGRLSLDTLIAAGSLAAFFTSAVNTVRGAGHIYFDTATMLPALVTFGKLLEATAKTRAGELVRGLETLLPKTALRVGAPGSTGFQSVPPGSTDFQSVPLGSTDFQSVQEYRREQVTNLFYQEVPIGELRVGDLLRVRPGERFAADGRIVEGVTTIAEAAFTGESQPRVCGVGGAVIAGTVNGAASVVMAVEQTGAGLLLHRIIAMVEQARANASPSERLAGKMASAFIPMVLALAAAAGLAWLWADGPMQAGMVVLAVLVVACPCAMGIAAPLATALAAGRAARAGVIVRGGDVLERAGQLDTIFFDKTGTLTCGSAVAGVEPLDGLAGGDELLSILASLESASEHVLGKAVLAEAGRRGLSVGAVSGVEVFPGQGIRGLVRHGDETLDVLAGTPEFVGGAAPACSIRRGRTPGCGMPGRAQPRAAGLHVQPALPGAPHDDGTTVHVSWGGVLRGRVTFRDALRPGAAEAIAQLRRAGVETVLLTGDTAASADGVAAALGITRVAAGRKPDEKIRSVQDAAGGHLPDGAAGGNGRRSPVIGMVGDGVNDAPALAAAGVGIALGAGVDLARQAGNVVLMGDRLEQIPWLVALARQTRRIIRQNLLWALGYNAVALAAAALGWLHPLLAAVAMVVSSLTVLSNSLRLARFPGPE